MKLASRKGENIKNKMIPKKYKKTRAMQAHLDRLGSDPDDVESLHKLIRLRMRQGEILDAVTLYLQIARRYLEKGLPARAVAALSHVLDFDSRHPAALRWLARAYLALGYRDQFMRIADKLLALGEVDVDLVNAQARIQRRRGRLGKALELLRLSVKTDSDNPATLALLAEVFLQNHQLRSASAVYRQLARIHCRKGEHDAMRKALRKMIEIESRREKERSTPIPMSGPQLKRIHNALESLPELPPVEQNEKNHTEKGLDRQPATDQNLRRGLAEADFFQHRAMLDEALDVLEELAAEHPGHPEIELRLSEILRLDQVCPACVG